MKVKSKRKMAGILAAVLIALVLSRRPSGLRKTR